MSKESNASEIGPQEHVGGLFGLLGGDFHDELFLQAKQLITAGKICNIGGSKSAPDIQESDGTITGWFTVTLCWYTLFCLCNTLWPLKSWLWCHSHRTWAVWPRVTSSCFWEWSHSCETVVPRMSVKFKIRHWPYYMQLQKKVSSDSVFSSGKCQTCCLNSGQMCFERDSNDT